MNNVLVIFNYVIKWMIFVESQWKQRIYSGRHVFFCIHSNENKEGCYTKGHFWGKLKIHRFSYD